MGAGQAKTKSYLHSQDKPARCSQMEAQTRRKDLVQNQPLRQLWPQIPILMTIRSQPGWLPRRAVGCGWGVEGVVSHGV